MGLKPSHNGGAGKILAEDDTDRPIEDRLRDIVVDLIVTGEKRHRESAFQHHKWELERRHRLISEARKARSEAERKERERLAAIEEARIDRLLGEAKSLQQARDIRAYVEQVRAATAALNPPVSEEAINTWTQWALAQADRIDPVLSRRFMENDELKSASKGSRA